MDFVCSCPAARKSIANTTAIWTGRPVVAVYPAFYPDSGISFHFATNSFATKILALATGTHKKFPKVATWTTKLEVFQETPSEVL